jgi:hypothetical protein
MEHQPIEAVVAKLSTNTEKLEFDAIKAEIFENAKGIDKTNFIKQIAASKYPNLKEFAEDLELNLATFGDVENTIRVLVANKHKDCSRITFLKVLNHRLQIAQLPKDEITTEPAKAEPENELVSDDVSSHYQMADDYVKEPSESQQETIAALIRVFGNHNSLKPVLFETSHGHILDFDLRPDGMTQENYINHISARLQTYRWDAAELEFLASLDLRWFEAENGLKLSFGIGS